MSAEEVAKAFAQHFYNTFDTAPDSLAGLYQPSSMLTFEGTQHMGAEAIITKIKSVGSVKHTVKSMDVQPSASPNAIIVFVTGSIQIGGDNPLHFCEMFQLISNGPGSYYVGNDVFRLNYGL
mmetsp:Transcript_30138/g.36837  ORF Transcript_30138/g.36837 Transcript_30138/m.36837 type:complete len:122 (-) Transcript_30138:274-639(-)|eukprot:CAMPEP_0172495636 /NCGR_PEP_ID=MMETSP1066-20121228/73275_1 /TAXON_ID=671091 /ORGANISM="Coscinodiscus wailesii, Strain CCMP2513" /LENGTH=121 /DNA_ID=CAMNT_0013267427 /DNA_START=100 /DNA_END=465 /DNA_ORIENTATION=+